MTDWPITYVPGFVPPEAATIIFHDLWNSLDWERREFAPRREYWYNNLDQPYTYGKSEFARTYYPRPYHMWIGAINLLIMSSFERHQLFEGCFLNGYETKNDSLGWHADDDPGIDHSRPIAVVTLYDKFDALPRELGVMNKETGEKTRFPLEHGSLLLMHPGMQNTHLHRIPRAGFECRPRISLTYRGLIQQSKEN